MNNCVEISGISNGYSILIRNLLKNGKIVKPRDKETVELSPCVIKILDPTDRIFYDEIRKMNITFSLAEWLWICSGSNSLEMLKFYNSKMEKYSDDGKTLHGAYGERLINNGINQFNNVIEKLKKDVDSRQAVMTIFDPYFDFADTKDVPCTIDFQFLIRDNKLNMISHMRSNDIYLGFPNDIFNFTMIQEMLAHELNIEIGEYTHIANSFHIYKENISNAEKIVDTEKIFQNPISTGLTHIKLLSSAEELIRKDGVDINGFEKIPFIKDILECFMWYKMLKNKDKNIQNVVRINNPYHKFFLRSLQQH